MCWSDAYLIPDLGYQYVDNLYNNATHIYNVETHVGSMGGQILYP